MSQYYYLSASLPMLRLDATPPISTDEFMEMCLRLITPSDLAQIRSAKLNAPSLAQSSIAILNQFQDTEFGLRNELVKLRAKKHGLDAEPYLHKDSLNPLWAAKAHEIFEEASPLRAENLLCSVLWNVLENLSVGHLFDLEFLILYYLKLQIVERKSFFQIEAGKQKLESILSGEVKNG